MSVTVDAGLIKSRKTKKPQLGYSFEQKGLETVLKLSNYFLRRGPIAKPRRKHDLSGQKGQVVFKPPQTLRKVHAVYRTSVSSNLSHVQHLRVNKNLKQVRHILEDLVAGEEAERWLSAPNALLGGARPVDRIKQGKTNQVMELLAAVQEGIYV